MLTGKAKILKNHANPVPSNYVCIFGWIFKRIPIKEANIIEGQETIPFGSTSEDELPAEVQIVRLDLDNREYCMRFLHVSDKDIVQNP